MGEPTSFTIQTTTEPSRKLELRGRALPYQPFELEGSMRAEFTWYPGNAVATTQMLGAQEKPTVIKGKWKDRFIRHTTEAGVAVTNTGLALFNGLSVADVFELSQAVEEIRLAGQEVEVTWDSHVRRGVLLRFRQSWTRREDLDWEMEFQWTSRGQAQSPVTLPANPQTLGLSAQFTDDVEVLRKALVPPAFSVVEEFTSTVLTAFSEIEDASLAVENAVRAGLALALTPVEIAERGLAAAESMRVAASNIVAAVEQFPPLQLIKRPTGDSGASVSLGDALASDVWTRAIKQAARALQATASAEADTLRTTARQESLLAVFVAKQPLDLRDVAVKYYGTQEEWRRILIYNALESSRLSAGQVVLVPRITFSEAAA